MLRPERHAGVRNRSLDRISGLARVSITAWVTAWVLACGFTQAASAQDWPKSSITLIVPYAAGGNTDTMARMLAVGLTSSLGQPVVVENKAGAAGALAAEYVSKAAKDGYTLLFATSAQTSVTPLVQTVRYNPAADFSPISIYGSGPNLLAVNAAMPAKTVAELIQYAKANPGKVKYGSGGNGTIGHLAGALFGKRAGIELIHVPYRGGAQVMTDLLAGHIDMYLGNASEILTMASNPAIRILGASSKERLPDLPNVPVVGDTLPGYVVESWNGLLAPAGLAKPILEKLERETIKAAREPAVIDKLRKLGINGGGTTASEFVEIIQRDAPLYRDAVAAAGIGSGG